MPKFLCSYAYDVPCYYDFTIEAENEAEAEKKIEEALANKKFDNICADPCWENAPENERVFVSGIAADHLAADDLDNLK